MPHELAELISKSSRVVVFTGAGISTESGISDYRSQGGLWQRFQPVTIQEFFSDEDKRKEYWRRKQALYAQMRDAEPNNGHIAIARLEKQGKLLGIITQNIDGLHHKAGNSNILEIHGTNREVICLECSDLQPFEPVYQRLLNGEEIPLCKKCGGLLKPNTISFGQALNATALQQAFAWARQCDLMIAAGSSLVVEPAASIPRRAAESGAFLVIINRDSTPLDFLARFVYRSSIGETLQSALAG